MGRLSVPFSRSYWVFPGRFLAGYYPGDKDPSIAKQKLTGLLDHGIDHVISLMAVHEVDHTGETFAPYVDTLRDIARGRGLSITVENVPLVDGGVPAPEVMADILARIEAAIARGRRVYVHCWGGIGRTGMVVGCFLVDRGECDGEGAIKLIATLREHDPAKGRRSPETDAQCRFVCGWTPNSGSASAS